ncbi:MAG: hypothetical protein ISN29_00920, partial [Gammaproteobacteria bacterium AqS3]|nr:hypothetical protein [Gammaproteobacteria bacterium AqS3]
GEPLTRDEGALGDLMVRLSLDPDADTTVQLTSDSSGIALSPATLSFTAGAGGNWGAAQRVTVSALQDLDALDETAEVSLTAPGAATVTARVSVDDDETLGIHIPSAPLSVAEGASAALSVRLTAAPPANTSVTVASDNDSVELSPTTLNFTPANWNIDQPVTVTAGQDADAADAASVINLTSPDLAPARVEVAIDDDEAAEMTLSNHSMSLHELDTGKFTVSLSAPPRVNVVVKLTSDSSDAIEISPIALIFTPADWSGQEVSITALDDPDALSPEDTTITVTAFGGSFDRLSGQVVVSVTDDDAEGLNLPGGVIRIDEGDAATFEVSLRSRPTDRVTLTLALSRTDSGVSIDTDASDAGDQNMLQFDASSWRTPRTVTLRAGNDADARDEPVTIRVSASGADYGDIDGEVSVLVIDRQTASIVLSGVGDGGIAVEEGRTAEFSVRLASEPSDSVTLTVTSADATALSPGADGSGATRTLGFTAANWNTGQSVRLTAVDDEDREGERVAVSIQAAGGDYDNLSASFTVTVSDDDAGAAPEQEAAAAELVLAEIVSAVLPAASDTIALRFGAPRGARTASVDGRRIALDRSLARDLAAGFAGRAGARGGSEDGRFDRDRFGAERHSADWLGGVPLE